MKILALAVEIDFSETALLAAIELLAQNGERGLKPLPLTVMVGPEDVVEARRLVEHMANRGELSSGCGVCANYLWTGRAAFRWAVIGCDAMVYSPGVGS